MTAVLHNCILHLEYVVYVSPIEISFLDRKKSPAGCYLKKDIICAFLKMQEAWTKKDLNVRLLSVVFNIFPVNQTLLGFLYSKKKIVLKTCYRVTWLQLYWCFNFWAFFQFLLWLYAVDSPPCTCHTYSRCDF